MHDSFDGRDMPKPGEALQTVGMVIGRHIFFASPSELVSVKEVVAFEFHDAHEGDQHLQKQPPRFVWRRELHASTFRGAAEPHLVDDALTVAVDALARLPKYCKIAGVGLQYLARRLLIVNLVEHLVRCVAKPCLELLELFDVPPLFLADEAAHVLCEQCCAERRLAAAP
eukprot:scaffold166212_cov28-Tisochrysis_lutea.AAC.2